MADIIERIIFDDSKALPAIHNMAVAIKEASLAMDDFNKNLKEIAGKLGQDVKKTNEDIAKSTKETANSQKEAFAETVKSQELYGISLNKIKDSVSQYRNNLLGLFGTLKASIALTDLQRESAAGLSVTLKQLGRAIIDAFQNPIQTVKGFTNTLIDLGTNGLRSVKNIGVGIKEAFSNPKKNLAEFGESLISFTKSFFNLEKAIKVAALSFNILKVAIIATGIGALVVALGGLISFITSTQKGMDLLSSKTAFLGGAFDVVKGKASEVGNAIVESFSNGTVIEDFGKLLQSQIINRVTGITDVFKNLWSVVTGGGKSLSDVGASLGQLVTGIDAQKIKDTAKEMLEVARQAESIQKELTELKREQAAFNVQFASSRAEVERLKKVGDDTTQTFNKRIEAVKKGAELESFINSKNLGFLKREIDLTEQRINLKGKENITDSDRQTLYDLQQKKAEALNDSLGKQTEVQNTINSLIKEFNDGIKTSQDALFEVAKTFGLISSEQELNFVTDKQLGALGQMKKLFEEGTKAFQENLGYGQDFTKEIVILEKAMIAVQVQARKIKELGLLPNAEINANTTSELKAQLKELVDYAEKTGIDTTAAQKKIQDQLIQIAKNPLKSLTSQIPIIEFGVQIKPQPIDKGSFLDGIETAEDLYNLALNKIFGDSDEKVKGLLSGLGEFVNVFGGILNEATDIQLGNLDKQLEKLSDRRAKLEEDLTNEQELYEQGLANNLGTKKQEVDLLIAEEERLNAEREKLQKEAQRRQIIAESAQQAQALITSSIQIIKGFAPLGPIGLGLGIAAVASLFGFFAKTKVEALKATKLHGGADSVQDYFGVPNKFGRSDIGNQKGYRLIDEDNGAPTNVIISAREMLIPEKVLATQRVFFDNLKAGLYDGYDLSKLIASTTINKGIGVTNINHTHINAPKEKKIVRQYVPFIGKDGKQRASLQTITEDMRDGSIIEFDY